MTSSSVGRFLAVVATCLLLFLTNGSTGRGGGLVFVSAATGDVGAAAAAAGGGRRRRDTFTSFFEVEFETNYGTVQDLAVATQALVTSYNKNLQQLGGYENNPHDIRMEEVEVLSTVTSRRPSSREFRDDNNFNFQQHQHQENAYHREMQQRNNRNFITVFLQGFGSCGTACPRDSRFTTDVSGKRQRQVHDEPPQPQPPQESWRQQRHRQLRESPTTESSSGRDLRYFHVDGYSLDGTHDGHLVPMQVEPSLLGGIIPSEDDLLVEYTATIRALALSNIVDVTNLDEIDELPTRNGSGRGSKSSSISSPETGTYSTTSSKKGKAGGSSISKTTTTSSSSSSSSSSRSSGSGNFFTSFFEIVYETNFGTDENVSDVAQALLSTYNRLVRSRNNCDSVDDIRMDGITVLETIQGEQGRRLQNRPHRLIDTTTRRFRENDIKKTTKKRIPTTITNEEGNTFVFTTTTIYTNVNKHTSDINENRDLQRRGNRITVFLQGFGSCGRSCPSDSRFTNDVPGRRRLEHQKEAIFAESLRHAVPNTSNMFPMGVNPTTITTTKEEEEPAIVSSTDASIVCALPTEDELIAEYSAFIASRDFDNIVDVSDLDEINELPLFRTDYNIKPEANASKKRSGGTRGSKRRSIGKKKRSKSRRRS